LECKNTYQLLHLKRQLRSHPYRLHVLHPLEGVIAGTSHLQSTACDKPFAPVVSRALQFAPFQRKEGSGGAVTEHSAGVAWAISSPKILSAASA
jgi:hypothetical protein